MSYKVGLISLGCPKNQVDAEIMLAALEEDEILAIQRRDGAVVTVHHLDVDANERDVALEDYIRLHRLLGGGEGRRDGQEHNQGGYAKR